MDITTAIEQVRDVIEYVGSLQYDHEVQQDDPDSELPDSLLDVDIYDDGAYNNLVDAQETLISALDLLLELKRLQP